MLIKLKIFILIVLKIIYRDDWYSFDGSVVGRYSNDIGCEIVFDRKYCICVWDNKI